MISKGKHIRAIKNIENIIKTGEIVEIIDIENNLIKFKFGGSHMGAMTFNEYNEYFEEVSGNKKSTIKTENKKHWGNWRTEIMSYHNLNGDICFIEIEKRTNGERVQVRVKEGETSYIKARSSCCPLDKFDYNKGLELAKMRLIIKLHDKEVREMVVNM